MPEERGKYRHPLSTMGVGDSFFVPNKTPAVFGGIRYTYKPKRFVFREVTENGIRGVRGWRIE